MKCYKSFIVFVMLFLLLLAGCSNEIKVEGDTIVVQKRVGAENTYEQFKEITDSETVQRAIQIVEDTNWENAEVSMVNPPDYKFQFEGEEEQLQSDSFIYDVWISPNHDKIELVIEGASKYAQLNASKSAELFEIITGVTLSEEK